jgi:hypothetical protein
MFGLVACGGDNNKTVDAVTSPGDSAVTSPGDSAGDTGAMALECSTYCTGMASVCTGVNAQYAGNDAADAAAHCMATCAKFDPSTAETGSTLGCRIAHLNNARTMGADVHCVHAGPAGDQVGAAGVCGDACTNFCTLEIAACGLMGAAGNTTGQYSSMSACMSACSGFDKTTKYVIDATTFPTTFPSGNNLACRLYHTTNALITGKATLHCPHTAPTAIPGNPCS